MNLAACRFCSNAMGVEVNVDTLQRKQRHARVFSCYGRCVSRNVLCLMADSMNAEALRANKCSMGYFL